jgi:hypothetical protein
MTRKQFERALAKYPGVTLDAITEATGDSLILDAPAGKVFAANGCHCLVEQYRNSGAQSWKPEAYRDIVARLEYGLRDCTIEDCDHCEEMQNETKEIL